MICTESVALQGPGSSDLEQLSEKDQREAGPLVDAFDLTVVSYYSYKELFLFCLLISYRLILFMYVCCTFCTVYTKEPDGFVRKL